MFDWDNFSKSVQRDLARESGLRVSLAAEDLAEEYGTPPEVAFVERLWPVLRDRWLGGTPASRDTVVTALKGRGLGDTSIRTSSKAGQMDYLKSCRNSTGLRSIVLEEFIVAGSIPRPASVMVDEPAEDSTVRAFEQALSQLDDIGVVRLEFALLNTLLEANQRFSPPMTTDVEAAATWVTSAIEAAVVTLWTRSETPPLIHSPARDQIRAGARMIASSKKGTALRLVLYSVMFNMLADTDISHEEFVATAIGAVLGILASGDLDPDHVDRDAIWAEIAWFASLLNAPENDEPTRNETPASTEPSAPAVITPQPTTSAAEAKRRGILGRLRGRGRSDSEQPVPMPRPTAIAPDPQPANSTTDARAHIASLLTELFGNPPRFDDDGDIPVTAGSAVVFLRLLDGEPFLLVRAFSLLVRDVPLTPALQHAMNEAQSMTVLGRLVHHDNTVFLEMTIPADQLTLAELDFLISQATMAADHFDSLLAAKFGGRTMLADRGEIIDA